MTELVEQRLGDYFRRHDIKLNNMPVTTRLQWQRRYSSS
jgi:hypothetical protein